MTTPTLTDEQIIAAIEALFPPHNIIHHAAWMEEIARPIARAILAALPTGGAGEVPAEDHDLDPQMALAYGRRMKTYCEAFDDRDWTSVSLFGSVDEKNLATALDNLTECAAMLMNMAGRVASPASSTGGVGSEPTRWHELKTDPAVFDAVASGAKTHEIRFDDRDYAVGDGLMLRRTEYTGHGMRHEGAPLIYSEVPPLRRVVTHVLRGYGLEAGWVILSLATPSTPSPAGVGDADVVNPSAEWVEAGLVCQACAGDAPGGKCKNPKCIGSPIVRELVPADESGVATPAPPPQSERIPCVRCTSEIWCEMHGCKLPRAAGVAPSDGGKP